MARIQRHRNRITSKLTPYTNEYFFIFSRRTLRTFGVARHTTQSFENQKSQISPTTERNCQSDILWRFLLLFLLQKLKTKKICKPIIPF